MHTPPTDIQLVVANALAEDIGGGDLTANLIADNARSTARVICRNKAILCGRPWFDEVFLQLDSDIDIEWRFDDGRRMQPDDVVCTLSGPTRPILTGERTALNFLQTLSGTATRVNIFSQLIAEHPAQILDTRKTLPGLRSAQKYAVLCGGGRNHRMGLHDAIMIKENHIIASGSIQDAVKKAKQHDVPVIVEVENLDELQQAMAAGAERVLIDNFTLPMMREAVLMAKDEVEIEASGGITYSNVKGIAATGVDYISIGSLTKHLTAVDFSMRFED